MIFSVEFLDVGDIINKYIIFKVNMYKETIESKDGKEKTKIIIEENRYKIGKQVGAGTFGKVYEATDMKTNKRIAIKEVFQDKKYKNRQLDVISTLKHQNIVQMKDYYFLQHKQDKYLYLVMDFYQSNLQTLFKQYRKQKKFLDPKQRKILAFQLFKALAYLKQYNVCHRDLKPPNVLVNPLNFELQICDFGSAKVFNKVERNVAYICSRYYRAPELLFNYTMYGTEVDVWSGGCILVQMLTREPIFPGDSALQQLIQIIKVLGSPSSEYVQKYAADFENDLNLPQIPETSWDRILKKYKPEPQLVDLISKILVYDTKARLTPYQILKHPYFHDLSGPEYKPYTDKLPNLFKFGSLILKGNEKQIAQLDQLYNKPKQPIKPLTSIQKQLDNESKLQTGDSTPLAFSEQRPQQNKQSKCRAQKIGTSDTIRSKPSIQPEPQIVQIN